MIEFIFTLIILSILAILEIFIPVIISFGFGIIIIPVIAAILLSE